ncbi:MAG: HAD-IB family phosphatase [Candidatus Promineifilaceae bacterium]
MRWPPYRHVFFDCDSTLTAVEGIDALAALAGRAGRVRLLTEAAMNGERELSEVYSRRLRALKPTRGQVQALRAIYKRHVVPDAKALLAALNFLGHQVYIVSGGLAEAVVEFGLFLGVPAGHIRAVGVAYNSLSGNWWRTDGGPAGAADSYLSHPPQELTAGNGKAETVRQLLADSAGQALLVGDGASDLAAAAAVDLFVGFGGVVARQSVAQAAPAYIGSASLAPVLALAAGPAALERLAGTPHAPLAGRCQALIDQGALTFNDERLGAKFERAYQAVHSRAD